MEVDLDETSNRAQAFRVGQQGASDGVTAHQVERQRQDASGASFGLGQFSSVLPGAPYPGMLPGNPSFTAGHPHLHSGALSLSFCYLQPNIDILATPSDMGPNNAHCELVCGSSSILLCKKAFRSGLVSSQRLLLAGASSTQFAPRRHLALERAFSRNINNLFAAMKVEPESGPREGFGAQGSKVTPAFKRCASHVYIARFIEFQSNLNR